MDSTNTPILLNQHFYDSYHQQMLTDISNNSTLHQDILNASDEFNNFIAIGVPVPSFVAFLVCNGMARTFGRYHGMCLENDDINQRVYICVYRS